MTINYPDSFSIALLQWKGSLWKAVSHDILGKELFFKLILTHTHTTLSGFYFLYYVVFFVQMFVLDEHGKVEMSKLIDWFERGTAYIPLTFLLGVYTHIHTQIHTY